MSVATALFDGPLDVVGDVHGEFDALKVLLQRLGYDRHGEHRQGRRLVFVGDLCDRGPDSPGVLRFVRDLCARDLAQVALGNHELNILRRERKHGNDWYFDASGATRCAEFADIREFLHGLPVALERADLRVVHACWNDDALTRAATLDGPVLRRFEHHEAAMQIAMARDEIDATADDELARHGVQLHDREQTPPLLSAVARRDAFEQMGNPLRVLTSGAERVAGAPFFAGGRWRMVERVPWWQEYSAATPVIFGHYWRWWNPAAHAILSKGEKPLFADVAPTDWLPTGQGAQAFCVDYSVGARYAERSRRPAGPFEGRLAAMRWPERELVFDA
jgi:hypothetical protein